MLLPASAKARSRAIKNRLFAMLIFFIQVCSPVMLMLNSLTDKDFQSKFVSKLPHRFGTPYAIANEFTCLGSTHDIIVTVMGAIFLTLFVEIGRAYSAVEFQNAAKMMLFPADAFWIGLGQFANMWCIFWSTLAVPIVFLDERNAKDIIFDSLGMLFVFTLDDISGDALDYLSLDDDTFQKFSGWTMGILSQCPRKISDIVNPRAQSLEDIFHISMGLEEPGLVTISGPDAGKRCKTRLMECMEPNEKTALRGRDARARISKVRFSMASVPSSSVTTTFGTEELVDDISLPYRAQAFEYCVCHQDPDTGEPTVVRMDSRRQSYVIAAWRFMATFLLGAEVVLPIVFLVVYNDCST